MANISQPKSFVIAPEFISGATGAPNAPAEKKSVPNINFIADTQLPDAQWNLGGVFLYDSALVAFCNFVQSGLNALSIENISGAPPCAWTLDRFAMRNLIPPSVIIARLQAIAKRPAAFVLQLDNPFIDVEMCGDIIGNQFLNLCTELPQMHVCVASETLAEYIRKKFPQAHLRAGVNKVIAENGRGDLDYYRTSAEKFSRVAIHTADACDGDFLEKLAQTSVPEKFEITVNDVCLRACPARREHLELLAKMRKSPWDAQFLQARHALLEKIKCEIVSNAQSCPPENRAGILTRAELLRAYALGFRHFRIQAENLRNEMAFFYELNHWTLSDAPGNWHKKAFIKAAISTRINVPESIIKSGAGSFQMRKYD